MNIVYLTTEDLSSSSVSGKVHFHAISREFVGLGHQVTVVAPRYSSHDLRVADGAERYEIRASKSALGLFVFELRLLFSLLAIRRKFTPDVFLVRGGGPGWLMGLVFAWSRLLGMPVVLECNGLVWEEFKRREFSRLAQWLVRFSAWQQAVACNAIIGVTREITRQYGQLGRKHPDRSHTIENGVDVDQFQFSEQFRRDCRSKHDLSTKSIVVGYTGSFSDWHGIPTILNAALELHNEGKSDVVFLLVGNGQHYEASAEFSKQHQLPNVVLTGQAKDREQLKEFVACFDVGLCTNVEMHGSPLKFFEYLAAGIPIIGSGFPQVTRILEQQEAGVAIQTDAPEELAAAIRTMTDDPDLWKKVGRRNRELAERDYSWRSAAERVGRVLESVAKNRLP